MTVTHYFEKASRLQDKFRYMIGSTLSIRYKHT